MQDQSPQPRAIKSVEEDKAYEAKVSTHADNYKVWFTNVVTDEPHIIWRSAYQMDEEGKVMMRQGRPVLADPIEVAFDAWVLVNAVGDFMFVKLDLCAVTLVTLNDLAQAVLSRSEG